MPLLVNYRNAGWGPINFSERLRCLSRLLYSEDPQQLYEYPKCHINKVYRLEMQSRVVVVKISPLWFKESLCREMWCYRLIEERTQLRVPEVLKYLDPGNDMFPGHEVLVLEYIEGRLASSNDLRQGQFHEELGIIVRQIHSINTSGFGWLRSATSAASEIEKDFVGMHDNWISFLRDIDNIQVTLDSEILKLQDYYWLTNEFESELGPDCAPKLLWGDFRLENCIITSAGLVPIDFQTCFSGDESYDIGIGLSVYPELLTYLTAYSCDLQWAIRPILLYAMRYTLSIIGYFTCLGNIKGAKERKKRFDELRDLYKTGDWS